MQKKCSTHKHFATNKYPSIVVQIIQEGLQNLALILNLFYILWRLFPKKLWSETTHKFVQKLSQKNLKHFYSPTAEKHRKSAKMPWHWLNLMQIWNSERLGRWWWQYFVPPLEENWHRLDGGSAWLAGGTHSALYIGKMFPYKSLFSSLRTFPIGQILLFEKHQRERYKYSMRKKAMQVFHH